MNPFFIARRYLFSPQSRSVVNLISGLSVVAVAMPVAAMIILLSVFNGFEGLVRSMYSTFDADLCVAPQMGQTFLIEDVDTAALRRVDGVGALSLTLSQSALLEHGGRQAITMVRGVDDVYCDVLPLENLVAAGQWRVRLGDLEYMVVGEQMAWQLGVRSLADADINVYAVRRGYYSSLLPFENYTRLTVPAGGVFRLDGESEQEAVYVSLGLAQRLFNYAGRASTIEIKVAEGARVDDVLRNVESVVGEEFSVLTRDRQRQTLYRIMTYEKWGIFLIALMVLVVASFSVVGALSMLVAEKRRDIATLGALGASLKKIRSIFRAEGYLICFAGGVIGVMVGVVLTLTQQWLGIIEIPAETFLVKSYPVELHGADILLVVASFVAVSLALCHASIRSLIKKI